MFTEETLPELSKDAKIDILSDALNTINKIIFARGAPLGSKEYFAIRRECVDNLCICGINVE